MNKWVCDNCGKEAAASYFIMDEKGTEICYWEIRVRRKNPAPSSDIGCIACDLCDECRSKLVHILKEGFQK